MTQSKPVSDKYMLCPFQIQMCDQHGGISLATAFFFELHDETFIITNWHNVTGKHPFTGDSIDPERSPLYIRAKWPSDVSSAGADVKTTHLTAQRVEIEDENGPLWFEHPTLGSYCDVVAIPTVRPSDWPSAIHAPANRIDEVSIPIEPGLKALIIGFPKGISTGPGFPLIKFGTLSSMPGYKINVGGEFSDVGGMKGGISLPAMLLDAHTLPGMSGSPVFGEHSGIWNLNGLGNSPISDDSVIGTGREFLGCHSSRIWERDERAGLGICYPTDVINEICSSQHRGNRFRQQLDDSGFIHK